MGPIRTILAATDFSPIGEHALDYAVDLASALGASVSVLYVQEIPVYGFPSGAFVAPTEFAERLVSTAKAGLEETVSKRAGCGVPLRPLLKTGMPADAIADVARETAADLVVMGTHGRGGISHAVMGSVAERVLRSSPCPVLVLRGRPDAGSKTP